MLEYEQCVFMVAGLRPQAVVVGLSWWANGAVGGMCVCGDGGADYGEVVC